MRTEFPLVVKMTEKSSLIRGSKMIPKCPLLEESTKWPENIISAFGW